MYICGFIERRRSAIDGFRTGIYEHVVLHWPSSPFRGRDRLASLIGDVGVFAISLLFALGEVANPH